MPSTEAPVPYEGDSQKGDKEKVSPYPLLDAFLQPNDDIKEFEKWTTTLNERTKPYIDEFDQKLGDYWGVLATSFPLSLSFTNRIYKPEMSTSEEAMKQVRLLNLQLSLLGFESGRNADWDDLVPKISAKFATHPYINRGLINSEGVPDEIVEFVKTCVVAGTDMRSRMAGLSAVEPKLSAPEPQPEVNWNPGVWGDFINGLDIDDFTGKRP